MKWKEWDKIQCPHTGPLSPPLLMPGRCGKTWDLSALLYILSLSHCYCQSTPLSTLPKSLTHMESRACDLVHEGKKVLSKSLSLLGFVLADLFCRWLARGKWSFRIDLTDVVINDLTASALPSVGILSFFYMLIQWIVIHIKLHSHVRPSLNPRSSLLFLVQICTKIQPCNWAPLWCHKCPFVFCLILNKYNT